MKPVFYKEKNCILEAIYDPATGEGIKIPAKTVVKMRIAKACKEAIVPAKGNESEAVFLGISNYIFPRGRSKV